MRVQTVVTIDLGEGEADYDIACDVRIEDVDGVKRAYAEGDVQVLLSGEWHTVVLSASDHEHCLWAVCSEVVDE